MGPKSKNRRKPAGKGKKKKEPEIPAIPQKPVLSSNKGSKYLEDVSRSNTKKNKKTNMRLAKSMNLRENIDLGLNIDSSEAPEEEEIETTKCWTRNCNIINVDMATTSQEEEKEDIPLYNLSPIEIIDVDAPATASTIRPTP